MIRWKDIEHVMEEYRLRMQRDAIEYNKPFWEKIFYIKGETIKKK